MTCFGIQRTISRYVNDIITRRRGEVNDVKLSVNVRVKKKPLYYVAMFTLKQLNHIRLVDASTAINVMGWLLRKGMTHKFKFGNDKWKRIKFDLEYEICEVNK